MQFTSVVSEVPFRQTPHAGQQRVFDALSEIERTAYLNVQLPTGYGKTFTACGCYSIKQHRGDVNRLLIIFPTDTQLQQFEKDNKSVSEESDTFKAVIEGPRTVVDIRFIGAQAIDLHRRNQAQIFVITIQALLQPRGADTVQHLMQTGRWMVVVDEYHHYGIDKAWGRVVRSLPAVFLLAMSATPMRPQDDSAFGPPHIKVTYREAVKEGKVKPLRCHSYNYRIDTIGPDGRERSLTTAELIQAAGTDSPEGLERWRIERKMRWSPQYVSPLVSYPIERMLQTRMTSGNTCLQVLIGALCVSHAELVCEQVRASFEELRVDWVGTGPNGRSDADNEKVLDQFCPEKVNGRRHPMLDVLVHVGMAGEGLDSMHVTEVVHANPAHRNNSNDQENGRASRLLLDAQGEPIEGTINVDATSDYARFTGDAIMDAMDGKDDPRAVFEPEPGEPRDFDPLPEEPTIIIYKMELESIDSGYPGVQRMAAVLSDRVQEYCRADLHPDSPKHDSLVADAIAIYREMRRREADDQNDKSIILQWQNHVNGALNGVVHRVIRLIVPKGQRAPASLSGELKKCINIRKKRSLGAVTPDTKVCQLHYRWLRNLEQEIIAAGRAPEWLLSKSTPAL